jgi:protein-tyrosine phosphatase
VKGYPEEIRDEISDLWDEGSYDNQHANDNSNLSPPPWFESTLSQVRQSLHPTLLLTISVIRTVGQERPAICRKFEGK